MSLPKVLDTVPELFAVQVARVPDAVAVVCGEVVVSWAGVGAGADGVGWFLRGLGVGAETVVGLCLERGLEMIVAVLGVWKAGAAYVPLDPGYPPQRLAFMLADSQVMVLVGSSAVVGDVPVGRAGVVAVDDPVVAGGVAAMPAGPPPVVVAAGQLAYVVYTSGSTGVPKGVAVTHGGLVNYLVWAVGAYGGPGGCGAPLYSSFAVDLTVTSVLLPLVAGS